MGREHKNDNGYFQYECYCGTDTEYGIFRYKDSTEWCIDSCCGACNAANSIKYCPYCGEKIQVKK